MRHRVVLTTVLLASFVTSSLAATEDLSNIQKELVGLRVLSVVMEALPPDAREINLTRERLQTVTELRLRRAGLRVVNDSAAEPLAPYLYVTVQVIPRQTCGTVYAIDVELHALFRVPDRTELVVGKLWANGSIAVAPRSSAAREVEADLIELLEDFENDFRAANPTR